MKVLLTAATLCAPVDALISHVEINRGEVEAAEMLTAEGYAAKLLVNEKERTCTILQLDDQGNACVVFRCRDFEGLRHE